MIMALPMGGGGVSTQDTRAHPECLSSTTRLVWEVSPGGYYAGPSYAVMGRALGECATPPVARHGDRRLIPTQNLSHRHPPLLSTSSTVHPPALPINCPRLR
jgi:hypothetical protein